MNDKLLKFGRKFRIVFNSPIQVLMRLVIGFLLIYFSLAKFDDPYQWAEVIYQYRLVPFSMVNFVSIFLSGLELIVGIGILLGLFTRASALAGIGLVSLYLAALQINIIKEVYIYCGCFRKQAYMTDVTYGNRNITFFVLILILLIFLNKNPRFGLDHLFSKLKEKRNRIK